MAQPTRSPRAIRRTEMTDWFQRTRARSKALFDLVHPDAYLARPIRLRQPIAFYEGHFSAFAVNTLLKRALGRPGIDAKLEELFERGIDPEDEASADRSAAKRWPSREQILRYVERADTAVLDAVASPGRGADPARLREAFCTIVEHELMHQETLLYMLHRLPHEQKRKPEGASPIAVGAMPAHHQVEVARGTATLGAEPGTFGWDNEFPRHTVEVDAFAIDAYNVTNADYLEFVEAGGHRDISLWPACLRDRESIRETAAPDGPIFWEKRDGRWYWRGMFEYVPLPHSWPVYVTQGEAAAYARWRGARLPTEAELHRAAYGAPDGSERSYPWGEALPEARYGNFDFAHWDPVPVGCHPAGASAWGVHDLVGNGWEWSSTEFAGWPGFQPMWTYPQYSADFFDGKHYVLKGASPATANELLRRSFRNWFRPNYPYMYASFRCVA